MFKKSWKVYLLECNDKTIYTGCTADIQKRLSRHKNGQVLSTKGKLPVKLLCYFVFEDKYVAYKFEKYLKSGSGSAFRNKRLISRER